MHTQPFSPFRQRLPSFEVNQTANVWGARFDLLKARVVHQNKNRQVANYRKNKLATVSIKSPTCTKPQSEDQTQSTNHQKTARFTAVCNLFLHWLLIFPLPVLSYKSFLSQHFLTLSQKFTSKPTYNTKPVISIYFQYGN